MPTISLAKKPEGLAIGRPSVKLKLASGHMPVKRSINFATVGEKPIDWRVAAPAIALIIVIAGMISKVAVYDRFAARKKGERLAAARVRFQYGGEETARFLCLTAELVGQQDRLITEFAADVRGGGA